MGKSTCLWPLSYKVNSKENQIVFSVRNVHANIRAAEKNLNPNLLVLFPYHQSKTCPVPAFLSVFYIVDAFCKMKKRYALRSDPQ